MRRPRNRPQALALLTLSVVRAWGDLALLTVKAALTLSTGTRKSYGETWRGWSR